MVFPVAFDEFGFIFGDAMSRVSRKSECAGSGQRQRDPPLSHQSVTPADSEEHIP
jgi:hypothetical protein